MPAFFVISGFFFKETQTFRQWGGLARKQVRRMLVPYFSFLISFFLLSIYPQIIEWNFENITSKIHPLIIGGRAMGGIYGAFWFVTVLFLTKLFIGALDVMVKRENVKYLLSFLLLILGYCESIFFEKTPYVFWNADVVLIAQFFVLAGRKLKEFNFANYINWKLAFVLVSILGGIVILQEHGMIDHDFDMKFVKYGSLFLSIILPVLVLGLILYVSRNLERNGRMLAQWLAYAGRGSLIIMFVHFAVNQFMKDVGLPGEIIDKPLVFTLIGVVVPLVFYWIFNKVKVFKVLFLGEE
jgi:fucose 4-O-acetylase-like acetyltransferase